VGRSLQEETRAMTIPTVQLDAECVPGGMITLTGSRHHYLVRVMRLRAGSAVRLTTPAGMTAQGVVAAVDDERIDVRAGDFLSTTEDCTAPGLTLIASPLKQRGSRRLAAWAGELGLRALTFVHMRYSVARLEAHHLTRLRRVAGEAARRVGRGRVPDVELSSSLKQALATAAGSRLCFLWEHGSHGFELPPMESLATLSCVVGPEGGYHDDEVRLLMDSGAAPLRLKGPAYTAETAAMAGSVMLLSLLKHI